MNDLPKEMLEKIKNTLNAIKETTLMVNGLYGQIMIYHTSNEALVKYLEEEKTLLMKSLPTCEELQKYYNSKT